MFELDKLFGLKRKRKRVGRGGSRGGTSGRGHKGQKARSGGTVAPGFEGGQMPLYRRLPKRGFSNVPFQTEVKIINLSQLEDAYQDNETVSKETLVEKGLLKSGKSKRPYFVKVLGKGTLNKKLNVHVHKISNAAKDAIEKSGGSVQLIEEK